ncbi:MAG: zf-TFIIB domain-containing protein [Holophaga sp.]|nr:zf-TFIIB domain-containing protein [Holophaga sp.]
MDAKTLNCQSCGAAVGEDDVKCPYCGSQLATLACPRCFGMVGVHASHCPRCGAAIQRTQASGTALACPGCRAPLQATAVGGVSLDQCHACGGVWVGQHNFEQIAGDRAERGEVLGALPGQSPKVAVQLGAVRYRPCPQCGKLMNRTNYGHISGVVLDVCKDHGLWFDRDELRQVLEFVEAGGLEKSHLRQVQEEDERRRLAVAGSTPDMGAWGQAPVRSDGEGLVAAFASLVHLFR